MKVVLIPAILLWRVKFAPLREHKAANFEKGWIVLIAYAAVASLWSPYKLSAVKMVGYLASYAAIYLIIVHAIAQKWLTRKSISLFIFGAAVLALIQTYVLGNRYGASAFGEDFRVTGLADPQSFSAYVLSMTLILLHAKKKTAGEHFAIAVGILMVATAGSRYLFVAMAVGFSIFYMTNQYRQGKFQVKRVIATGLLIVVLAGAFLALFTATWPESRLAQLASFTPSTYEDVGTFAWRLVIYAEAINRISSRNIPMFFFGSGTSSGGDVKIAAHPGEFDFESVDANRSVHDEFLRALYEWGLVGLGLLLFIVIEMGRGALSLLRQHRFEAAVLLAAFPAILFGLTIENILAGAGGPTGIGYTLSIAFTYYRWASPKVVRIAALPTVPIAATAVSRKLGSQPSI